VTFVENAVASIVIVEPEAVIVALSGTPLDE